VSRSYLPPLLTLSAIWGSSYMFIKIGLRDFPSAALVDARLLFAAIVLVGVVLARGGVARLGPATKPGVVVGTVGMALPFLLIAWGETHVDSGVAAVANSSVPIFVALLAIWFAPSERSGGLRGAGLAVGLAGVAVVVGIHPAGGWWGVVGTLAVVLASLCYAASALFIQRRVGVGGPELAASSVLWGFVVLLPFALADPPQDVGWKSLGAAVALGVLATGVATLIVNHLIAVHGPARTMLVNYLLPGFALAYGVTLLDEPLTVAEVLGLALILVGVTLAAGLVTLGRRVAPVPEQ
jgi:drug/metabolite transporter (DMT)-like permease